jgi:hypothetical protein
MISTEQSGLYSGDTRRTLEDFKSGMPTIHHETGESTNNGDS